MTKAEKKARQEEAATYLRKVLGPTPRIWGQIMKVSASGMFRRVQVLAVVEGEIRDITGFAAQVLGTGHNEWGLAVPGCGFCAVDHTASNLGYALFGKGSHVTYTRL